MPLEILDGPVIRAGESLSEPLDCRAGDLVRITCPGDWTPAMLTFQISSDGEFFNDLYFYDGEEIAANVVPGVAMLVPDTLARALGFIRFRSGTADNPVPQGAERVFAVAVMRELDDAATP